MDKVSWETLGAAIVATLMVIVVGFLTIIFAGFLIAVLWNASISPIFNLPEIDVIQGVALGLLTNLLFGTPLAIFNKK